MNVEAVYKSKDAHGRQVLFARLENGKEGVIRYAGGRDIATVDDIEVNMDSLHKAYQEYDK
jgi:hypothetical protein